MRAAAIKDCLERRVLTKGVNVFNKLDIQSRRELANALPGSDSHWSRPDRYGVLRQDAPRRKVVRGSVTELADVPK
jgi:hypothetical protein